MADFCKACSDKLFGPDMPPDLGGITKQAEWEQGKAVAVLCEGCGPIQVDPEGNCVSQDCLCEGEPGHGMPWYQEPCAIDFCGTPTGRLQTTEPQPIAPRTEHQLAQWPTQSFDYSGLEERALAMGSALIKAGGDMLCSAGTSSNEGAGFNPTKLEPLFPPFKSFEVTGWPLEELVVEQEYQFDLVSGEGLDAKYTTKAWPGVFSVFSVRKNGPGVEMEVGVGREEPPIYVKTIHELLNQAIKGVENSAGTEAWAEFKRFHGNAVVYAPISKELGITTECLSIVYSLMRVYHPGIEVTGLVQSYCFDGPAVKVFGKFKEEADPNARADLKDA